MDFVFDKKPSSNLSYIYSVCVVMTTYLSFQNVFFIEMQQITLCLACFQGVVVVTGGGGGGGKIIANDGWSKLKYAWHSFTPFFGLSKVILNYLLEM